MKPAPDSLLNCGLLLFGRFGDDPLRFHAEMLPSFPGLMQELATLAAPQVNGMERLLAAPGAMPWGIALALQTGVPLVVCRGSEESPALELVGAYDIGHPTLLLGCGLDTGVELSALAERAGRVGLEVQAAITLLGDGRQSPRAFPLTVLFSLPELVAQLVADGALPAGHGALVQRWLLSRHQAAAAP